MVCHGDACAPNTLLDEDGRCCGHVDLGELGVADRWADLAVATLSLGWNYPGQWQDDFFTAYGVEPDPVRIGYYRRLWNAGD
ncbi:Aminoglycoside 3'-phosphotransferase [Mycobacterium talmoniae]|uniref:Aminoglycoside 3'-phosphotransferase n=1 Tax=Mycobacterium talmoniae TaxID=1858794 RepID=A0A2S8BSP6_9MYCO|nr:Aminoglycoside 3'-phosphotransferase [Mycobacterium talmoniae]